MTDKTVLLDPAKAIEQNCDPMGNTYEVVVSPRFTGLYEIAIKDGHHNSLPPDSLRGHWTNHDRATAAIKAHLSKMWTKVEAQKKPLSDTGARTKASAAKS